MSNTQVHNTNVAAQDVLLTPAELNAQLPLGDAVAAQVRHSREAIWNILQRRDPRLFVVVGPCSIHDPAAALDYARKLRELASELDDTLLLVMRAYFEKPRTTVGWKGLINDPHLDDSFCIQEGLQIGRRLLLDILEMGLPTATEALDPISPQYLSDLISWSAIGARTTESQTHREMASGLSSAVGFKNGTDGNLTVAINALQSVAKPHRFLGINSQGQVSVYTTRGNQHGHLVLRGGNSGPNYDSVHIKLCEDALEAAQLPANIVVDCSHANSEKKPELQPLVARNVTEQILAGNRSIVGLMLESNLQAGRQDIPADRSQLRYGVSVTDGCIDWQTTEQCLREMADRLRGTLGRR